MCCSLLHLSTLLFYPYFLLLILPRKRVKIRNVCISLFIMRYFYTAEIFCAIFQQLFLSSFALQSSFMFLQDKLLCQLVLLLRINSSTVQFFTHFSAVPQNYFSGEELLFCWLFSSFASNLRRLAFRGQKKNQKNKKNVKSRKANSLLERNLWKSW